MRGQVKVGTCRYLLVSMSVLSELRGTHSEAQTRLMASVLE